ncbi:uncharacterized protein LOC132640857 [Lycium barbarum]|uniref:uncharacterized protein LOC132051935 n=1 Tax=Lycium ferocissimum TaxID=112874 RepID=UPI00281571FC|nr:uncharacterized protein LOC132051935 [Lycium ferocissimum]XP_059299195.1 uncharacterized protein LOC132051935 [Lycium ferocissimum]XP_060213636.1 uncharacterized protein LOC132640857 [Lycium barbarum]XP_060213645.1 uncharacterized protein LOC132640857 [Lycium barbarum]
MKKLVEFGRKAMFYIRVLSGYEERRIRSYRLQMQQRLQQAEEKKVAIRKMPEQMILSEVRRMVEEMQALNKKLEDTEAAIDDYFKPINMEAEAIVKMQLEGEENRTKEMMNILQKQAFLEKHQAEKLISAENVVTNKHGQDKAST